MDSDDDPYWVNIRTFGGDDVIEGSASSGLPGSPVSTKASTDATGSSIEGSVSTDTSD